ncbi:periplasmic heavy metal sensor [Sulfitobacter albidus]|uniref:Periplasmic heavy metal sensor n=1 Tax=Sulfitobacter albidus TaxID=2829501 RepID=A0A975JBJ6_9RHOB|nr:periplasmic heavy metal sensor [Sulfitobacter albidus]QUJ75235.1 periplasmic heavy metal sensor [Sulfitobacter albidus]
MSMDAGKPKRGWLPYVLALSLAVNLVIGLAVAGALWRASAGEGPRGRGFAGPAPYLRALERDDRAEVRAALRALPRNRGESLREMLTLLRAERFDRAAAAVVLGAQREASLLRQDTLSAAWLDRVSAMSDTQRAAYVARLEEILSRRSGRKGRD